MAADAADRFKDTQIRGWVRGRAAIALGYEGASPPVAHRFALPPEKHSLTLRMLMDEIAGRTRTAGL
ncbi:hypothetical protein [Nocardia sp. NPDC050710]|uniref:hypothetical protein n=1 Tax=Nocardia sp. NPDC050710 TaxID=3157220 RepID=UPI0033C67E41